MPDLDKNVDIVARLREPIPDVQEFSTPVANDDPEAPIFDPLRLDAANALEAQATAISTLTRQLAEAREALKPFAEFAEEIARDYPGWDHDDFAIGDAGIAVPFRYFRAARRAQESSYGQ